MYTVMQIRFKRPTKSLTYATREEDLKHFNVDSGEEIPSQMNKKQNVSCRLHLNIRYHGCWIYPIQRFGY